MTKLETTAYIMREKDTHIVSVAIRRKQEAKQQQRVFKDYLRKRIESEDRMCVKKLPFKAPF